MIPTYLAEKSAFEFAQNLELVYRETAQTPPEPAKAQQQGLLFYESGLKAGRVIRYVTENLLSKTSMINLKKLPQVARKEYFEEHLKLYFALPKPFGLELPMEYGTDVQGGGAVPTVDARPAKVAMPWDAVHFPLMTSVGAENPAVGKEWKGVVKVRVGFGEFNVGYTGKWLAVFEGGVATAQLTFDPPTGQEVTSASGDVKLQFKAAGSWKVQYRMLDGCPMVGGGEVAYVALATAAPDPGIEVINAKVGFKWRFVPVGFTEKQMMTASWGMMEADFGV